MKKSNNKTKKTIIICCIILAIILITTLVLVCLLCDFGNNDTPESECNHKWSNYYLSDTIDHWKECSVCHQKKDVAKHTLLNNECECGYIKYTEGLEYTLNEDGNSYSVTGIGNADTTIIAIPSTYDGKPITKIGASAFEKSDITNFSIGNNVEIIEQRAFAECSDLEIIKIPSSVKQIDKEAFMPEENNVISFNRKVFIEDIVAWCNINFVEFSSQPLVNTGQGAYIHNTYIANSFLYLNNEQIVNLEIPESVTKIGNYTFAGCKNIQKISLPKSLVSIGDLAFIGLTNCTEISIPSSVVDIGLMVFYDDWALNILCEYESKPGTWDDEWNCGLPVVWNCKNNEVAEDGNIYTFIDGIRYALKDSEAIVAIQSSINIPKEVVLPRIVTYKGEPYKVTTIGDSAFINCKNLTSITLPNSLKTIQGAAFINCTGLINITIPNSVTSIGNDAFEYCNNLKYTEYDNGLYLGNEQNLYMALIITKSKDIPGCNINNNTKIIAGGAFYGCNSIIGITIPDNISSIGDFAFYGCTKLFHVSMSVGVNYIGNYAFYYCNVKNYYYNGTRNNWKAISKGDSWCNKSGDGMINCTDGKITDAGHWVL